LLRGVSIARLTVWQIPRRLPDGFTQRPDSATISTVLWSGGAIDGGPMTVLFQLAEARARRKVVTFERRELRDLLNLYSRRVAAGEWRDYAIDFRPGVALFSIFRRSCEQPLFAIAKVAAHQPHDRYQVFTGPQRLAQAATLADALRVFDRKPRLLKS
jgi:hypothetical protein